MELSGGYKWTCVDCLFEDWMSRTRETDFRVHLKPKRATASQTRARAIKYENRPRHRVNHVEDDLGEEFSPLKDQRKRRNEARKKGRKCSKLLSTDAGESIRQNRIDSPPNRFCLVNRFTPVCCQKIFTQQLPLSFPTSFDSCVSLYIQTQPL